MKIMFQYLNKLIKPNLVFKTTKLVTLCFACTIILFACKQDKDILPLPVTPAMLEKGMSIDIAKAFFNAYMDFIPRNFKFKSIKPFYEGAVLDGNVVEIPFAVDGKMASISQYDNFEKLGKQRLIIVNKPNIGLGKECYILNYAPSKTFSGKLSEVTVNNFQAKQFDGVIIVQNLDGQNVVGYSIEGGKIKNTLSPRQDTPNKRGKLDFCEVSTYIQYCQASMGDFTTPIYPCGFTHVVDCYMFGGWNGAGWPWSDGGGSNSGGNGGGGGNGGNSNDPNDPSWGWGNNNGAAVPITVIQMCPHSIMQGFQEAGNSYVPSVGGTNMGNLSGRSIISSGGHYWDMVAPARRREDGGAIYIPRFGLDISMLNPDVNNPNAMIDVRDLESLSNKIAEAYQDALTNWVNRTRLYTTNSFSPGLDFLNEWKAVFNQLHPNNHMEISFNGAAGVQVRDTSNGCIR